MARISELHYSDAYAASSGVNEFVEVALSPGEDPADYSVALYNQNGTVGLIVPLDDPGVTSTVDPDTGETIYVISADNYPFLITDPTAGSSTIYEGIALYNDTTGTLTQFYDIGGGGSITATNGPAAGVTSTNVPVPTGPNSATYTPQWNQPDPTTLVYENVSSGDAGVLCFAKGMRIRTPDGQRRVEALKVGDLVNTVDHGPQPIRWIGARTVDADETLAPIRFEPGAMGLRNTRPLIVSPQHRLLMRSTMAELYFGTTDVLVPAKFFVNGRDVVRQVGGQVSYYHLMFDDHELIWSENCQTESFFVAETSLSMMSAGMQAEFAALFPALMACPAAQGETARQTLDAAEAEVLRSAMDVAA